MVNVYEVGIQLFPTHTHTLPCVYGHRQESSGAANKTAEADYFSGMSPVN